MSDYLMRDRGFIPTISLVVPRDLAGKVRYDECLSLGDDYDFAIRLSSAGAVFLFVEQPGAAWNDQEAIDRLSASRNVVERLEWLDRIRPLITRHAYMAELGWPIAKAYVRSGQKFRGLCLYWAAVFFGCYRPKMALVIFLQVHLSVRAYRRMSDLLARHGVGP